MNKPFHQKFSSWTKNISSKPDIDWTQQLIILNQVTDLITSDLTIEEIIATVYENVNLLMDAHQFCIGLYDEKEGIIHYRGMIEDGLRLPDFTVNALDPGRLASWCIINNRDIFINDMDKDYINYLSSKPDPITGIIPQAALYSPLELNHKVAGLIVVRTIRKNCYQRHHLYLLKTVGNFIVRALELRKKTSINVPHRNVKKQWAWVQEKDLQDYSRKKLATLTEREKEVLFLLISGLTNKVIAEKLFVAAGTIKTHTLNIYHKMEVDNRSSAIIKALELGWIA